MKVLLICNDNNDRYKKFIEDRIDSSEVEIDTIEDITDFESYLKVNDCDRIIVESDSDTSDRYREDLQEFVSLVHKEDKEVVFLVGAIESSDITEMYFDEANYIISRKYAIVKTNARGIDAGIWRVILKEDIEEIYKILKIDENKDYIVGSASKIEQVKTVEDKKQTSGLFGKLFGKKDKQTGKTEEAKEEVVKNTDSEEDSQSTDTAISVEDNANEEEKDDKEENLEFDDFDSDNDEDDTEESDSSEFDDIDNNSKTEDSLWDGFEDEDDEEEINASDEDIDNVLNTIEEINDKTEESEDDDIGMEEDREREESGRDSENDGTQSSYEPDAESDEDDRDGQEELADDERHDNDNDREQLYKVTSQRNNFSIDYSDDSKGNDDVESKFNVYDSDEETFEEISNNEQLKKNIEDICKGRKVTLFIGTRNSGTTTTAFNFAKVLEANKKLVAYIDLDISMHGGTYLNSTNFGMIHSDQNHEISLNKVIERPDNCYEYAVVVSGNIQYFGIGITSGPSEYFKAMSPEAWYKLIARLKTKYDAIVIDAPFSQINKYAKGTASVADNILMNVEWSTKSFMELMLYMGNVTYADDQNEIFDKGRIIINKYRPEKVFGQDKPKVKYGKFNVGEQIDIMMYNILGDDYQFEMKKMEIAGVVKYDAETANSLLQKPDRKQVRKYFDLTAKI